MKKTLAMAAATLAAGCVSLDPYSQPVKVEAGPEPTAEQVEPGIRQYLTRSLKDPDSLKQFRVTRITRTRWFLGAPISKPGAGEGWLTCFEYNAKNSYGGYVGLKVDGLVFRLVNGKAELVMHQDGAIMAPRCT